MSAYVPPAKLPNIPLPQIRSLPHIPFVGCAGGSATTFIGEQFGDLPDMATVLHIKALKKSLEEQIYALIQGELPDALRPPVYAARAAQLVAEVLEIVATLNTIIGGVIGEAEAAISFVNGKIGEMNAARAAIMNIPPTARTAAQRLMLGRYNEVATELNGQISRLQSTITCIAAIG
jgi:hypothetical protein